MGAVAQLLPIFVYFSAYGHILSRGEIMKRLIAVIMLLVSAASATILLGAGREIEANTDVSYILIEADTRCVLDSQNSDLPRNAGYMSKLMSLLLIAEDVDSGKYGLTDELTASQSVAGTKGSVVWLQPGDTMTVDELIKSVAVGNANDALTVLAERSEGAIEDFVIRMNTEAFDLGLRDTSFYSPYGYYDERENTTANDIALVCAELSKYSFMTDYFSVWRDFVRDDTYELVNENSLSRTYDKHIGFKACHSEQAGYCLAEGGRSEDGTCYIAVVLGGEDYDCTEKLAKKLCNKGFSDYKVTVTMFPDEMLAPLKVINGEQSAVMMKIKEQSSLVIPRNSGELKTVVVLPDYVNAPVHSGQTVGSAAFFNGKTLVYESDIVACEDVEAMNYCYVLKKMLSKLIE